MEIKRTVIAVLIDWIACSVDCSKICDSIVGTPDIDSNSLLGVVNIASCPEVLLLLALSTTTVRLFPPPVVVVSKEWSKTEPFAIFQSWRKQDAHSFENWLSLSSFISAF